MVSTVKTADTTIIMIFPSLSGVLFLIDTLLWLLFELCNFVVWTSTFTFVLRIVLSVGSCFVASLISVFVAFGVGVVFDDAVERIVVLSSVVKLLNCVIGSRS